MKVMHLISGGDVGGAKTHVLTLLQQLNKTPDIDVRLLCVMEGGFTDEAREMAIPVHVIPQRKRYDIRAVFKIAAYIKKERFDIIHCHGARANFIALFLSFLVKTPMVTTVHSDYLLDFQGSRYKQRFYTPLNTFALHRIRYKIAITENFKQMLVTRNFAPERIFVVYNGVDFDTMPEIKAKETFLAEYGLDCENRLIVGVAARFHPVKGVDVFLKAARQLIDEGKDYMFLIAGAGEEKAKYAEYIHKNGMDKQVKLLGFVQDVHSFYHALDINVLSSYSESFPYSLLEGARLKRATVSSSAGGIPEMIKDGESGLLFEPGDAKALAGCIMKLAQDEELRNKIGAVFFREASEHFSVRRMAATHLNIYQKIAKENEN